MAGAITYGHQHPLEAFMGPLQAGQRALRASELNDFGGEHNDIGHAFMTPKVGPRLQQDVDTKLGIGPGGRGRTALPRAGCPRAAAR